jgi:hypothetical protein
MNWMLESTSQYVGPLLFAYLIYYSIYAYKNSLQLIYFFFSVQDKKVEIIGVGTTYVITCTL